MNLFWLNHLLVINIFAFGIEYYFFFFFYHRWICLMINLGSFRVVLVSNVLVANLRPSSMFYPILSISGHSFSRMLLPWYCGNCFFLWWFVLKYEGVWELNQHFVWYFILFLKILNVAGESSSINYQKNLSVFIRTPQPP